MTQDPKHELTALTIDAVNRVVREFYFDMDDDAFKEHIYPQIERLLGQNQFFAEMIDDVAMTAAKVQMSETVIAIGRGCMAAFLMGWVARERYDHEALLSAALQSLVDAAESLRDVDPSQTEPWELSQKIEALDAALTDLAVAETGDTSSSEIITQEQLLASESTAIATENAETTTDAHPASSEGEPPPDDSVSRPN